VFPRIPANNSNELNTTEMVIHDWKTGLGKTQMPTACTEDHSHWYGPMVYDQKVNLPIVRKTQQ
jgi:hypothetical protein